MKKIKKNEVAGSFRALAPLICLLIIVFVLYLPSLKNAFVWDDNIVIVNNDFIKSWQNLPKIFSQEYLTSAKQAYSGKPQTGSAEGSYRPVVTMTYFIDYHFWKLNPFGYHLTNLFIHLINTVLVFILIFIMIGDIKAAFLTALIFGIHPVQTEVVDNISFREDLLFSTFYLGSLISYITKDNTKPMRNIIISGILFLLALFSKEMAVTLPGILLLYDLYFEKKNLKNNRQEHLKLYLVYVIILVFYFTIWKFVFPTRVEPIIFSGQNAFTNFYTMSKVFGIYIIWLVVPLNIHATLVDLSIAEYSLFSLKVIGSIALILSLIFYAFKIRQTSKHISFSVFFSAITLLPVTNIVPLQNIIACRYLYLPIAGYSLLIVLLFNDFMLKPKKQKRLFGQTFFRLIFVIYILFLAVLTVNRHYTWQNGDTFFLELAKYYPQKSWVHKGLATSFAKRGLYEQAISEYNTGKFLDPDDLDYYDSLGRIYLKLGMYDRAYQELEYVINKDKSRKEAYLNYCRIFAEEKKYDESARCYNQLITIHPNYANAYNDLAVVYFKKGEKVTAEVMRQKAFQVDPTLNSNK